MNRYRPLLAALLFAALGASPTVYLDDGGMLGSGTRADGTSFLDDGGYLGSGNKSDDGGGGTIGSGTRTSGTSLLDENRGGYFGSGH